MTPESNIFSNAKITKIVNPDWVDGIECEIYAKHHNTINGIYMDIYPESWDEISEVSELDSLPYMDDEVNCFELMLNDLVIYDIHDLNLLNGFTLPSDRHGIKETIFILMVDSDFFLCETQGENYVKFSINISKTGWVNKYITRTKFDMI